MFGLCIHLPLKFFSNFWLEGQTFLNDQSNFLDDTDVAHIFEDKGKLNRIIKNHPLHMLHFCFSLKFSSFLQILSLKGRFYLLPGIAITPIEIRKKNPPKTNLVIVKNSGNEQMTYYAPEISKFFRYYDYGMILHL